MVNSIVKALNDRFDAEGYAHVTMKDKDKTVVTIKRYDDWDCNGSTEYEVSWGFNGSYGKFCDTIWKLYEQNKWYFDTNETGAMVQNFVKNCRLMRK